jgi:uncharacterized lipoprotein YehR (DUF1307 family)
MIISAVVASIIVIALSASISEIQSQKYKSNQFAEHINQIREEAKRITNDGSITSKEMRNFRKMTGYIDGYEITTEFNTTNNCVEATIESTDKRAELPCIN